MNRFEGLMIQILKARQVALRSRPLRIAGLIAMLLIPLSGPVRPAQSTAPVHLQTEGCALPPPQTLISNVLGSLEWNVASERTIENVHSAPYREVDVTTSGRVEGCTTIGAGRSDNDFSDVPDLMFPQVGQPRLPLTPGLAGSAPLVKGLGFFQAQDGSGMHVLYPESRSAWNGKVFVVQHGGGIYSRLGELVPRESGADFDPRMSRNFYVGLMIDRGYAVVWIRKGGGVDRVDLEDGTSVTRNLVQHATLELALTSFSQRFLTERLGTPPRLTYFYGFSAAGRMGRLMSYAPGANLDAAGSPIVDGFLLDDASLGLALPVLFAGDRDVLFESERDRANFAPQIDVTHALYNINVNLAFTRENTRLLQTKGLGDKHRAYEVRGVSHFVGGSGQGRPESLDLGGFMEAMIDLLDQWVDGGVAPPPTRSDAVAAGPAVALPEVACPLGVHYPYPADAPNQAIAVQTTTFAAFDGAGPEPLDWRGSFVDMNESSVHDERESIEAAWRRLGLLGAQEAFTPERYTACVEAAAVSLAEERLLPWRVVDHYRSEASRFGTQP
jgi:hypothetical protein